MRVSIHLQVNSGVGHHSLRKNPEGELQNVEEIQSVNQEKELVNRSTISYFYIEYNFKESSQL